MRDNKETIKSDTAIGFSIKMDKLPLEIVNAFLRDCSIISPKINAKINGAAGILTNFIKKPITPKNNSKYKSNTLKLNV